ncbi:MAG: hypothetical protein RLY86_692 [Pseudomonadota bacterium]|jgi:hypothetical protein
MRIRATSDIRCDGVQIRPGDELELDDAIAVKLIAGGSAQPVLDGRAEPSEVKVNRAIDTLAKFVGCTIDDIWRALAPLHGPAGALSAAPPAAGGGGHPGLAAPFTPDTPELAGPEATGAEGNAGAGEQGEPAPGAPPKGRRGAKAVTGAAGEAKQ